MPPLVVLYFFSMFAILFITILKIQNIILGLLLGNSIWFISFTLYFFRDILNIWSNNEHILEFIYPVFIISIIFSIIRLIKYHNIIKKETRVKELDKMKIKDM